MATAQTAPPASIVIPTRGRPDYLKVALASIAPQAKAAAVELVVVDDAGAGEDARRLSERFGARYEPHPHPLGLNAARNTGVRRSGGELVVFVDDDVQAGEGWLAGLLAGARGHPEVEVFAGRIVPRLEGKPPRSCGREGPPVTSLQLGERDLPTDYAWGSNMAIRRTALGRVGPFDVSLQGGGDEQEWQDRLRAAGGRVLYLAGATLYHRRSPRDARLRSLCAAAFARGRAARRFDAWRGQAPPLARELATLGGCLGHVLLRRCPAGMTMVAHSAGRVLQALARQEDRRRAEHQPRASREDRQPRTSREDRWLLASRERPPEPGEDFLSGESGTVGGFDAVRRALADLAGDGLQLASGQRWRLRRAARSSPPRRRVLVLGVQRPQHSRLTAAINAELRSSRHDVELRVAPPTAGGKFENLNALLASRAPVQPPDWVMVVDDDIVLPSGFVDRFLFLAERFAFDLAQPAHAHRSHAAWRVTRRRARSVARETQFVEIGPVTAFGARTLSTLLPFPRLQMGWGLDAHWAALAREHEWRCGVIDALVIHHRAAPGASAYSRQQAISEARDFLQRRPYMTAREAQRTLTIHRSW